MRDAKECIGCAAYRDSYLQSGFPLIISKPNSLFGVTIGILGKERNSDGWVALLQAGHDLGLMCFPFFNRIFHMTYVVSW
jgi:hypothetical protein